MDTAKLAKLANDKPELRSRLIPLLKKMAALPPPPNSSKDTPEKAKHRFRDYVKITEEYTSGILQSVEDMEKSREKQWEDDPKSVFVHAKTLHSLLQELEAFKERFQSATRKQGSEKAVTAKTESFDADKFEKSLTDAVAKIIGKKVPLTVTLGPKGLLVTSPDLVKELGVKLFKSLSIKTFNHGINPKADAEIPEDEAKYWLTLSYEWTSFGGGSNGTQIGAFWMTADGKIKQVRSELT